MIKIGKKLGFKIRFDEDEVYVEMNLREEKEMEVIAD